MTLSIWKPRTNALRVSVVRNKLHELIAPNNTAISAFSRVKKQITRENIATLCFHFLINRLGQAGPEKNRSPVLGQI